MLISSITYTISKPGFQFVPSGGQLPCGPVTHNLSVTGTDLPTITSVSEASYESRLASDMLAAVFGTNLAQFTEFAQTLTERMLADRSLFIKEVRGVERSAQLIFVSPTQINYVIPPDVAEGPVTIRLATNDGTSVGAQFSEIRRIAPGVFSANSDGRGVASAMIVRVKPGNVQSEEPVAKFDEMLAKFVAVPIDLGPASEIVYLALFGTGWRNSASISTVTVTIGGVACEVQYAGKQPTIDGLDQINVRLARELIGRGDVNVEVRVNGVLANPVLVNIK